MDRTIFEQLSGALGIHSHPTPQSRLLYYKPCITNHVNGIQSKNLVLSNELIRVDLPPWKIQEKFIVTCDLAYKVKSDTWKQLGKHLRKIILEMEHQSQAESPQRGALDNIFPEAMGSDIKKKDGGCCGGNSS